MVAPLSLCVLRLFFHPRDFRFHRLYQLGKLFLAFLSCLGVLWILIPYVKYKRGCLCSFHSLPKASASTAGSSFFPWYTIL